MLKQIMKDIFLLKVPYPYGMAVNSYIIQGVSGLTIIDPGYDSGETRMLWKNMIQQLDKKIEKVIITHTHPDHIGLAPWFQKTFQVPVYISNLSKTEIDRGYQRSLTSIRQLWERYVTVPWPDPEWTNGFPQNFQPDGLFFENDVIEIGNNEYIAISTPGHAADQFCFYNQDEQLMFVSDHVLQETSPIVSFWNREEQDPLEDYFTSLTRVSRYSVKLALPGHGSIMENFSERVSEIRSRHELRLEQIVKLLSSDGKTVLEIVKHIYGNKKLPYLFSPVLATLTRLLHLEKRGLIGHEKAGAVIKFFPL